MAWLYIPNSSASNSAPASACSAKDCVPDSHFLASTTAPFATWSGKPLQPRNLSRLWKRERSIRRLSGLTLSPSTADAGVDAWISSSPAFRAKTSASPAYVLASMAYAAGSSSTCSTSPTLAVRSGSFWRTSQASLLPEPPLWTKPRNSPKGRPPASWGSWPTAGGVRNGSLWQRPTLVLRTVGRDGSASHGATWATPTAHDGRRPGADLASTQRTNLNRDAALWQPAEKVAQPTSMWASPTSRCWKGGGNAVTRKDGKSRLDMLDWQAEHLIAQWPTPAASDASSGGRQTDRMTGQTLVQTVNSICSHPVRSTTDGRDLSPTTRTLRPRLNPAFGCWLMGWPVWWTNPAITSSARSEMALWRCRLQSHLSSLCAAPLGIELEAA